jgi:TonB family protein
MTPWLSDLLAYSVQLAVLVGTGSLMIVLLRINAPRTTLRFWQIIFATTIGWPVYQIYAPKDVAAPVISSDALWSSSLSAVDVRAALSAIDSGVSTGILALFAAGAVFKLAWIGVGLMKLRSIRAESQPADSQLPVAAPLQQELGVYADIRFSEAVSSPATFGARRPAVLLPRRVRDLPTAVQRALLTHELMHVQRRDWMAALVEELWRAVLWFHPAAHALVSRLSLARETLVDEATIARTCDRRAYAAALLEFSTAGPRLPGAAALIGLRHLERRIALIAQEIPMTRSLLAFRTTFAAIVVAAATLMITLAVPIAAALEAQAEKVYKPSPESGVTLPQLVREVKPGYTAEAMQARIQGTVWLATIVLPSGDVGDVTVIQSLDKEHGLDDEAVNATRRWKFKPGTKDGTPVAVEVTIELTFTLKK